MIQVFLIDKHALVRSGTRLILESADDISVCGEAENAADSIDAVSHLRPDLILLDCSESDETVLESLDLLHEASPDSNVLGLAGSVDQKIQESAIKGGARGVVLTFETASTLLTAIRKVCQGEAWINRSLAAKLLGGSEDQGLSSGEHRILSLTHRERDIVKLIANGLGNNDIANELNIAEKTVRNHLTVVYSKLRLTSRVELALYAVQRRIK